MVRKIPPSFSPRMSPRQLAEALNELAGDLYAIFGTTEVAAPLQKKFSPRDGLRLSLETSVLPTGGDVLSTLVNTPNTLTNPSGTTLVANTLNVITATLAGSVKLPAPTANLFVGIQIANSSTASLTLNPYASETIDGASSLLLWAGATLTLYSDGTNWFVFIKKCIGASPSPPTGLTATAGNQKASLGWTAPSPSPPQYRIYYSTSPSMSNPILVGTSSVASFTVTGLTNGVIYYFGVTSVSGTLTESSFSNIASATPSASAPAYRSYSYNLGFSNTAITSLPLTVTAPAGLSAGDQIVVITSANYNATVSAPSGFSVVQQHSQGVVWTKTAGASEPGSYTFTATVGTAEPLTLAVIIVAIKNVSAGILTSSLNYGTGATATANGLTFSQACVVLALFAGDQASFGSLGSPWTHIFANGGGTTYTQAGADYQTMTGSGSTSAASLTAGTSSTVWEAFQIAVG